MIIDIARNELRRMFMSPLAWVILAIVQFLLAIFFFVSLVNYLQTSTSTRGITDSVIAVMFQNAGLIVLLISPFLTMRLFSEEYRSGTFQLLLSSPIYITEMVLGKYLGILGFMFCLLFMIALMPLSLFLGTEPDSGQVLSGLLGLALLMSAISAIGLFISTLTRVPAVAAISTFAVIFILWIIHIAVGNLDNDQLASVFSYLSMLLHFNNMLYGLFSSNDVIYYLLIIITFNVLSIWRLDAMRTHS